MEKYIMNMEEWTLEKELNLQKRRDILWKCNMGKKRSINNRIAKDKVWNDEDWEMYVGEYN